MSVLGSHREEQAYAAAVVLAGGLMGYLFVGDFGLRQGLLGVPPAPAITIGVPKVRAPVDGSSSQPTILRSDDGVTISVPDLDAQPSSTSRPDPIARPAPSPGPRPSPSASPVPVPPPAPSEEPDPTQEPPDDDPSEEPDDDDGPNNPKNSSGGGNPKPPNNNNNNGPPKPGPKHG